MLKRNKLLFKNPSNPMFCEVIKRTILTEKSTSQLESNAVYMFEVQPWANKIIVRNAIINVFKVRVLKVNIMNVPGKEKRKKSGIHKTSMRKIAIVHLHGDDVILLERR